MFESRRRRVPLGRAARVSTRACPAWERSATERGQLNAPASIQVRAGLAAKCYASRWRLRRRRSRRRANPRPLARAMNDGRRYWERIVNKTKHSVLLYNAQTPGEYIRTHTWRQAMTRSRRGARSISCVEVTFFRNSRAAIFPARRNCAEIIRSGRATDGERFGPCVSYRMAKSGARAAPLISRPQLELSCNG